MPTHLLEGNVPIIPMTKSEGERMGGILRELVLSEWDIPNSEFFFAGDRPLILQDQHAFAISRAINLQGKITTNPDGLWLAQI